MFQSLQGCRAVAAALVVLFHLGGTFAQEKYFGLRGIDKMFGWGDAGVEFFFVLSGFLITIVHRRDFGQPKALRGYVTKRLLRVYPTYWLICGAVGLAALFVPSLRQALPADVSTFIAGLTLVPLDPAVVGGTGSPILFVAWSLQYEITFYAMFAVAILSRVAGVVLVAGWIVLYALSLAGVADGFPLTLLSNNLLLLFGLGVACAYLVRSDLPVPAPRLIAAAAAVAFVAYGLYEVRAAHDASTGLDRRLVYGALSSLIVIGLVRAEATGALVVKNRWMGILGDASYALYLIHVPVISALVKLFMHVHITNRFALFCVYFFIFVACVGSAVAFHLVIERPMLDWLRRHVGASRPRVAAPGIRAHASRHLRGLL